MGALFSWGGQGPPPPTGFLPSLAPDNVPGQPHSWPQRHTPMSQPHRAPQPRPAHAGAPPHSAPSADPSPAPRRKKNPVPATYLKEPVAPPVEGGDDGGMDIAAVQALGREEKREFSWKEGRKGERRRNRRGGRKGHVTARPARPRDRRPVSLFPTKIKVGDGS